MSLVAFLPIGEKVITPNNFRWTHGEVSLTDRVLTRHPGIETGIWRCNTDVCVEKNVNAQPTLDNANPSNGIAIVWLYPCSDNCCLMRRVSTMDKQIPKFNLVDELVEEVEKSSIIDDLVDGIVAQRTSELVDNKEMMKYSPLSSEGSAGEKSVTRVGAKRRSTLDELVEGILFTSHVDEDLRAATSRARARASATAEHAKHEAEVQTLTLLQQNINGLAKTIDEYTASDHVKCARDRKFKLVLGVLYQKLRSDSGQRLLRCEANMFHKGDVFAAEKSLIHTCKQSTLLRMSPYIGKKFHDRKNKALVAAQRKASDR